MDDKTIQTAIAYLRQTPGIEIKRLLNRLQLPYRYGNGKVDGDKLSRYLRELEQGGLIVVHHRFKGDKCTLVYPPGYKFKPLFQSKNCEPPCRVYRPGDPDYPGIPNQQTTGFRLAESYSPVEYKFLNSRKKAS